jgi:acyl-CoA thioester hydrolase
MRHVFDCPLRWSDMDVYGHVNNARFLTLLEEARVDLFFIGARASGLTSFEEGILIARHEVDYLRPVGYSVGPDGATRPPQVRVELWVEAIQASRITVGYEVFDADVVAIRARTVCVPFDRARQRPRRVSGAEREFLGRWLVAPPPEVAPTPPEVAPTPSAAATQVNVVPAALPMGRPAST